MTYGNLGSVGIVSNTNAPRQSHIDDAHRGHHRSYDPSNPYDRNEGKRVDSEFLFVYFGTRVPKRRGLVTSSHW